MIEITQVKLVLDYVPDHVLEQLDVATAVRQRMSQISQDRLRQLLETGTYEPFSVGMIGGRIFLVEVRHTPD